MFVETCSLGCSSGQGGSQVFCSIVNTSQNQEIAQMKMPGLNAHDISNAMRIVEGTARSMGLEVVEG